MHTVKDGKSDLVKRSFRGSMKGPSVGCQIPVTCTLFQDICSKQGISFLWSDLAAEEACMQVRWIFFDGAQFDIMTFKEGKTLPDEEWQAPTYCFEQEKTGIASNPETA